METGDHLLWVCEFAQRVWQDCPIQIPLNLHDGLSFKEFIMGYVSELMSPGLEIVFTTAWAIWRARNEVVWNDHITLVSELCQQAARLALEYIESGSLLKETMAGPSSPLPHSWKAPAVMNYKVNLSYQVGNEDLQIGLRVLIRDSFGLVATAMCSKLQGDGDALKVFAMVVLAALKFAHSIGLRRLEVELGNKELLGLIRMTTPCLAPIGVIIEDIWSWLHLFYFINFSFIRKDCNKVAHALATEALSSNSKQVWLEDHPVCITSFVQSDYLQ